MPLTKTPRVLDIDWEDALGAPLTTFAHQCHVASIALVKSGALPQARVARGMTPGIRGQHSWVVLGNDCYDEGAWIIDPTLWSYTGEKPYVWQGLASVLPHRPHGLGSIWAWGQPQAGNGPIIEIEQASLPESAMVFLDMLGPLDAQGWASLLSAPVGGWEAGAIIQAAYETPALKALVPIDRVGMLTDLNPEGLYLAGASDS